MIAVRVPFHLMRRPEAVPASAVLLLSTEVRDLLSLCGHLRADPMPLIFPVEGGFLVIPEDGASAGPAGAPAVLTLRLRRLSENCFIPADAELVPALHPHEAADLTRQRGLVFLPGSQCLAFNPDQPVSPFALLKFPVLKREEWQPFPDPPPPPRPPDPTPDEILNAGGAGIAEEAPPRPPKANPAKTAAGKMALGLGKGLAAIGAALGMGALARLGQDLIGRAAAAVPRLSEALLGKQEAALRELLKKFREGRINEALRNALPMGGNAPAAGVHTSDQLPTHDINYSLSGLMGSGNPGTVWVGGGEDLQRELMNEYRKAAQAALECGDYRRAAFIYGKLLGELHMAADILAKGGLHRDAAILYRDLLNEPRWAAREFELAGDWEEAVRLFREIGEHEAAGDLLRRVGEEDQAIEEYYRAAAKIVEERRDYLKAGDLMLRKTGRADLAGAFFTVGWRDRGKPPPQVDNALPCAGRLAEILAFGDPLEPFMTLIGEVDDWLKGRRDVPGTAQFFNAIAKLAELPHLAGHRGAIRDRCKLALAARLRDHRGYENRPGNIISDLFGNSGLWPAAVVSDANFALRSSFKRHGPQPPEERPANSVKLGNSTVTAAVFAPGSGEIVVGFANGEVIGFNPESGLISPIAGASAEAIEAIAVDERARLVVAASGHDVDRGRVRLRKYRRGAFDVFSFACERIYELPKPGWYCLNPLIHTPDPVNLVYLSTASGTVEFTSALLIPRERFAKNSEEAVPNHLILPASGSKGPSASRAAAPGANRLGSTSIIVEDRAVIWREFSIPIGWRPVADAMEHVPLAWLRTAADRLEIAGISEGAVICWSEIISPDSSGDEGPRDASTPYQPMKAHHDYAATDGVDEPRGLSSRRLEGYRAVTIWKPGMMIGVTANNRVCWLRAGSSAFQEWAKASSIPIPTKAVACFPSHATGQVVVIMADGEAVRVPVPL